MSFVSAEIEIDAPPQRVWEIVMDPTRLSEWVTIHRRLEEASDAPLRAGSTLRQSLSLRGVGVHVDWTVVDADPPRAAHWEGQGPAHSRASIEYLLTPLDGGRTRFRYRNDFHAPMGPLGAVASRVVMGAMPQREAQRTLDRLKALLEARR